MTLRPDYFIDFGTYLLTYLLSLSDSNIFYDTEHRAAFLRQLSFLLN